MSLIRVFEIPEPTGNFHFNGGEPVEFVEVDWFVDDGMSEEWSDEDARQVLRDFVRGKRYYDPRKSYLILHHRFTTVLNMKD